MSQLYADILVGPTASGKSAVAQFLAQQTPPRPIISADSMAIYRGMDIGTAKPTAAERAAVPSFGFDLAPPDQPFSAGNYLAAIRAAIPAITAAQATPIVVGGTGLYVKALTLGLDPPPSNPELRAQAENILQTHGLPALQAATRALNPAEYAKLRDPENPRRVIRAYELLAAGHPLPRPSDRPRPPMAGLLLPSDELHARIARRARQMFAHGLVEEVRRLRQTHPALSPTARHAIGYEEAAAVLDGRLTEETAIRQVTTRTRQYAKRQMTWFRNQADVRWVEVTPRDDTERLANKVRQIWSALGPTRLCP
ncbi:MAG: tRNA (adenosine(37)-N6)-dimethylallyltransferase MiaA [Kiritimatiellia bacterium]|jgi:tRNA dimethylallyltransferase|nr:tRNA (adenosine(37)-N6)-dimethylallyltransferase MiaA [Lentisphaerota bacterium]